METLTSLTPCLNAVDVKLSGHEHIHYESLQYSARSVTQIGQGFGLHVLNDHFVLLVAGMNYSCGARCTNHTTCMSDGAEPALSRPVADRMDRASM